MRTAVVTGAMSGIGEAVADALRRRGDRVVTVDLSPSADISVDVSNDAALTAALADIDADILVNSAGIVGPNALLTEIDDADWRRVFAVNVLGTVSAMRALVPGMVARRWGRVVNVASIAGKDGNPRLAPYSASKAAVIALTKSAGKELARDGVLVNAIAPAVIATPMNAATDPDVLAHITSLIPMGRTGAAAEVAELIRWLTSDLLSFSTGAVYDISGGRATY